MPVLGKKQAARYAERIAREREERLAAEREASYWTSAERQRAIEEGQRRAEERQREAELERTRQFEEQQAKQREAELARSRELMGEFKRCEDGLRNAEEALRMLEGQARDLTSLEGALAAAEQAAKIAGARLVIEQADADLRQAEHAIGRHRTLG